MSFDYIGYWENTYKNGGNSGAGSYGMLAEFKAEVINRVIALHKLTRVIEFGCGDGNQLSYMDYKKYLGLDVSALPFRCAQSDSLPILPRASCYTIQDRFSIRGL
ncbi:hypothetical protein PUW24_09050 [Paenibacillus urinalis]|uniref:Class I SAM-dependent methyltransferase n=1 Tax=Paenibacillus urinalis TaxID=521520 RepID=A0ABY7XAJ9_9BACL|nr:hypothetical protein [Paenibacillus urinalis]WDH99000.1 hypothetical protein PUW24_09050 [Paenibacillus urinalis]WDI02694.1 hypothetical protein PUW25_01505 [Paenibacillus urinalis]